MRWICLVLAVLLAAANTATASARVVREAVETAAEVSGKNLTKATRKAAQKALAEAFAKYGDDALRAARHGGLEAIRCGARYGDDFWRLTRGASPHAVRSLALHADELMPIAKRIGAEFMLLEGKAPGLGAKVVAEFGDDAARMLARTASADDIAKLAGYAGKADSPATKKLLAECYGQKGHRFLEKLDWKKIMATGLSAAAVTAAYKISDGVEEGIKTAAKENPEQFAKGVFSAVAPIVWALAVPIAIAVALVLLKYLKLRRKRSADADRNSP